MKKFATLLLAFAAFTLVVSPVSAARTRTVTKVKTVTKTRGRGAAVAPVAQTHAAFTVFNTHRFATVGHGYGYGYNATVYQPVTFAVASPLAVSTYNVPVQVVNTPAVATCPTTTVAPAVSACQTATVAPAVGYGYGGYATQRVINVQRVHTVNVPLGVRGVHY